MLKVSLNMMLWGKELRSLPSFSLLQLPETKTGLTGEGAPFFLWKKGLVTEKKPGDSLFLTSCAALGQSLNLTVPQFPLL